MKLLALDFRFNPTNTTVKKATIGLQQIVAGV
jgi:hypothetical protein